MPDYRVYRLSRGQTIGAAIAAGALGFAAAWLLFNQLYVALVFSAVGYYGPGWLRERLRRRRQASLRRSFREMLQALSSLLSAGRSIENAFAALEEDLALLIGDPKADLLREIRAIVNGIRNGEPPEARLADFAARSGMEEVRSFAEVFSICKKAGGDLIEVVRRTAGMIGEKMEVEQELQVLMAQKKLESRLMMGMPFAFVGLLGLFAGDYMSALHQGVGWIVLVVCLLLLAACGWWMTRIMDIRL